LTISEIFSNLCRSRTFAFPPTSLSSNVDESPSSGEPDLAMTRNVSVSKTTASTARQMSRRKVKWEVMRPILGMRVWTTEDHAWG
jgi:hypothetical protein